MSGPLWTDVYNVTHWVVHPEDHAHDSDMTVCWQTVLWAPRPSRTDFATCIACVVHEPNMRAARQ